MGKMLGIVDTEGRQIFIDASRLVSIAEIEGGRRVKMFLDCFDEPCYIDMDFNKFMRSYAEHVEIETRVESHVNTDASYQIITTLQRDRDLISVDLTRATALNDSLRAEVSNLRERLSDALLELNHGPRPRPKYKGDGTLTAGEVTDRPPQPVGVVVPRASLTPATDDASPASDAMERRAAFVASIDNLVGDGPHKFDQRTGADEAGDAALAREREEAEAFEYKRQRDEAARRVLERRAAMDAEIAETERASQTKPRAMATEYEIDLENAIREGRTIDTGELAKLVAARESGEDGKR